MKVIVAKNYEEMSEKAFEIMREVVVKNPSAFYKELSDIEDRANAVFNLLLKKSKIVPKYAPDLLTKTIKY